MRFSLVFVALLTSIPSPSYASIQEDCGGKALIEPILNRIVLSGQNLGYQIPTIRLIVDCREGGLNLHTEEVTNLYFSAGYITQLSSYDELAFLLAHEVGHVIIAHNLQFRIPRYSVTAEDAADELGLRLMNAANYQPSSALEAIYHYVIRTERILGYSIDQYDGEHRTYDDRNDLLKKFIARPELRSSAFPVTIPQEVREELGRKLVPSER